MLMRQETDIDTEAGNTRSFQARIEEKRNAPDNEDEKKSLDKQGKSPSIYNQQVSVGVSSYYKFIWNLPSPRYLFAKSSVLDEIEKLLEIKSIKSESKTIVVSGKSGTGKTRVVLEYCRNSIEREDYNFFIWFPSESAEILYRAYFELCVAINIFKLNSVENEKFSKFYIKQEIEKYFSDRVKKNLRCLFIYDNYSDFFGNEHLISVPKSDYILIPMIEKTSKRIEKISNQSFSKISINSGTSIADDSKVHLSLLKTILNDDEVGEIKNLGSIVQRCNFNYLILIQSAETIKSVSKIKNILIDQCCRKWLSSVPEKLSLDNFLQANVDFFSKYSELSVFQSNIMNYLMFIIMYIRPERIPTDLLIDWLRNQIQDESDSRKIAKKIFKECLKVLSLCAFIYENDDESVNLFHPHIKKYAENQLQKFDRSTNHALSIRIIDFIIKKLQKKEKNYMLLPHSEEAYTVLTKFLDENKSSTLDKEKYDYSRFQQVILLRHIMMIYISFGYVDCAGNWLAKTRKLIEKYKNCLKAVPEWPFEESLIKSLMRQIQMTQWSVEEMELKKFLNSLGINKFNSEPVNIEEKKHADENYYDIESVMTLKKELLRIYNNEFSCFFSCFKWVNLDQFIEKYSLSLFLSLKKLCSSIKSKCRKGCSLFRPVEYSVLFRKREKLVDIYPILGFIYGFESSISVVSFLFFLYVCAIYSVKKVGLESYFYDLRKYDYLLNILPNQIVRMEVNFLKFLPFCLITIIVASSSIVACYLNCLFGKDKIDFTSVKCLEILHCWNGVLDYQQREDIFNSISTMDELWFFEKIFKLDSLANITRGIGLKELTRLKESGIPKEILSQVLVHKSSALKIILEKSKKESIFIRFYANYLLWWLGQSDSFLCVSIPSFFLKLFFITVKYYSIGIFIVSVYHAIKCIYKSGYNFHNKELDWAANYDINCFFTRINLFREIDSEESVDELIAEFYKYNLVELTQLDLSLKKLTDDEAEKIVNAVINQGATLKSLDLSWNFLVNFNYSGFENLYQLQALNLSSNFLVNIEGYLLNSMENLNTLSLANNSIRELNASFFIILLNSVG